MENLRLAIEVAVDCVESIEVSTKEFRDAVYEEAGVSNKSEYFAFLIADIADALPSE